MFPWLTPIWDQWLKTAENDHLSAATLVTAEAGLGVQELVRSMAKGILCQNSHDGCGFCHSCQLFEAHSHPDFHSLTPEKPGKSITVDQIRTANRIAFESSQLGGRRVIVIDPADRMNESASNALLKTLEEPPEKCFFILVANQSRQLLPTIISRCRKILVPLPRTSVTVNWLMDKGYDQVAPYMIKLSRHAPLTTLTFLEQQLDKNFRDLEAHFSRFLSDSVAELYPFVALCKSEPNQSLLWMWYLLTDVEKIHSGVHNPEVNPQSDVIAAKVPYSVVHEQRKALANLIDQLSSQPGLNEELLITNWLLNFIEDSCL